MFKRILIANRGEIACRVIRTCKAMGIETVAVYSEADEKSRHVRDADQAVCIGPAPSAESYLNMQAILDAAERTEAKAIHPGYGFLSENALFSDLCAQRKFTFIGPSARVIRLMGDKATARRTMKAVGIPIVPGSEGLLATVDDAVAFARTSGYPVLLKATAGGGGKGMRVCRSEDELKKRFPEAAMEAQKAFGNPGLYLERFVEKGRHIEFQFFGDAYGNGVHLFERECSVQRNHQKLIEESLSPVIDEATRTRMGERVAKAISAIGYQGAGTMEFLLDSTSGELFFMEVNTRLQVEHPVTEMLTGLDLVKEQIQVAANHRLSWKQADLQHSGHAIECRVNAEDPSQNFKPSPGVVTRFEPPTSVAGATVRVETYLEAGAQIPVYYDSMVCKLIVHAADRDAARRAMLEALGAFKIEGVKTTIPIHLKILSDERFASGRYHTGLVAELGA
ncbi:MAG TPA: acetyl-CoA carboxylase biotin carboxylase subunit [Myxococcales bacterium]|jgi:acetyl-CoA carboxylase biotin carboxylase subunit